MSKSEVKLTTKVMENLIKSQQHEKILNLVREDKFSQEAMRYALLDPKDKCVLEVVCACLDRVSFSEIFNNYVEYVNSELFMYLYEKGFAERAFCWITDFVNSSEELIDLYSELSQHRKVALYKNLVYRHRECKLNESVRDKYLNCFDGIYHITTREYMGTAKDCLAYMFFWALTISAEWGEKAKKLLVATDEEIYNFYIRRIDYREYNFLTVESITDLQEMLLYLSSNSPDGQLKKEFVLRYLFNVCNPLNWGYNHKFNSEFYFKSKSIYDMYVRPLVVQDTIGIYSRNAGSSLHGLVFMYEQDEEVINETFKLGVKRVDFSKISNDLQWLVRNANLKPILTKYIIDSSELLAKTWREAIIDKPLDTAEKIIAYGNMLYVDRNCNWEIDELYTNPFALNNIKIDELDEEEIDKLSAHLDFNKLSRCFKDEAIPYEFLMKYKNRVSKYYFPSQFHNIYSISEIISIFKEFSNKMNSNQLKDMVSHTLMYKEGLKAPDAAYLLSLGFTLNLNPYEKVRNTKLDIDSILTLI